MAFPQIRRLLRRGMARLQSSSVPPALPRRGIFGGTFNPPHWGHLAIAQAALQQAHLQQVIWVPTYHPPHRSPKDLLEFEHRWQMVQRAIAPNPAFAATDLERRRGDRSFAIDTLHQLQQEYPPSQWFWILGLDSFESLPHWYRSADLVPQCCWLIAPRQQSSTPTTEAAPEQTVERVVQTFRKRGIAIAWQMLQMPSVPISSTLIRERMGQASQLPPRTAGSDRASITSPPSPIHALVPPSLEDYILEHKLYR